MTITDVMAVLPEVTHRSFTMRMTPETRQILEHEFQMVMRFMPGATAEQRLVVGNSILSCWLAGCEDQQKHSLEFALRHIKQAGGA
jgi:hypothetical protein